MKLNKNTKILIVGLGLIGGSYALSLSESGYEVGGVDISEKAVKYALENRIIRHGRTSPDPEYIGSFDLIVFALYPHVFIKWLKENQQYIKSGALITDVTGVKKEVVYPVQAMLRADLEFIGAHPMAGRETSGIENANKEMFCGANYIITPTERNTKDGISLCHDLGQTLGFGTISVLTPEQHDEMIGFLSQLTHCIAVSLMTCKDSKHLVDYTGDSFRDLTRIAKINEDMWTELFLLNKRELLEQMDLFSEKFRHLRESIASSDSESIKQMMRLSTERRKYFDK